MPLPDPAMCPQFQLRGAVHQRLNKDEFPERPSLTYLGLNGRGRLLPLMDHSPPRGFGLARYCSRTFTSTGSPGFAATR